MPTSDASNAVTGACLCTKSDVGDADLDDAEERESCRVSPARGKEPGRIADERRRDDDRQEKDQVAQNHRRGPCLGRAARVSAAA